MARYLSPIDQKFLVFHRAHPEVYVELVRLAREAKAAGATKLGISLLWERMRWSRLLAGQHDIDGFKLSNDLRSRYSRLIMYREPDLDGLFEIRTLRSS